MNCNLGNNLKRLRLAKNIEEQTVNLAEHPHEFYSYINLLVAYLFANENQKALEVYLNAKKEFADQALLYTFVGDLYRRLKMYDQAFECWNKTLELNSEIVSAMWSKATCYEEIGNHQAAYQVWLEIIEWFETRGYEIEVEEPRKRARDCKNKI